MPFQQLDQVVEKKIAKFVPNVLIPPSPEEPSTELRLDWEGWGYDPGNSDASGT